MSRLVRSNQPEQVNRVPVEITPESLIDHLKFLKKQDKGELGETAGLLLSIFEDESSSDLQDNPRVASFLSALETFRNRLVSIFEYLGESFQNCIREGAPDEYWAIAFGNSITNLFIELLAANVKPDGDPAQILSTAQQISDSESLKDDLLRFLVREKVFNLPNEEQPSEKTKNLVSNAHKIAAALKSSNDVELLDQVVEALIAIETKYLDITKEKGQCEDIAVSYLIRGFSRVTVLFFCDLYAAAGRDIKKACELAETEEGLGKFGEFLAYHERDINLSLQQNVFFGDKDLGVPYEHLRIAIKLFGATEGSTKHSRSSRGNSRKLPN